jgi:hypothetical protein
MCSRFALSVVIFFNAVVTTAKHWPHVARPTDSFYWYSKDNIVLLFATLTAFCVAMLSFSSQLAGVDCHDSACLEEKHHGATSGELVTAPRRTHGHAIAAAPCVPHVAIADLSGAGLTTSNPLASQAFDSDIASGHYVFIHRPLDEGAAEAGADAHARYFSGKQRLWEVRFQCTFKQKVKASTLRIGSAPYERIPLGARQVAVQRMALKMAGPMLGGFYNSPGDAPDGGIDGELECPVTSIPICEVDQHIFTMPGETPPDMLDDAVFPSLGELKSSEASAYRKQMNERIFEAGETHTFAYWGPSKAVDLIKWQIAGVPMLRGMSLDTLNGPPPLVLAVYVLKPGDGHEARHLESRKSVVWHVAGWSSNYAPTPERLEEIFARAGCDSRGNNAVTTSDKNPKTEVETIQTQSRRHRRRPLILPASAAHSRLGCCSLGVHKLLHDQFKRQRHNA